MLKLAEESNNASSSDATRKKLEAEVKKFESEARRLEGEVQRLETALADCQKALEKALVGSHGADDATGPKARWNGQPYEDTIEEGEEPPPSAGLQPSPVRMSHRREVAQCAESDN